MACACPLKAYRLEDGSVSFNPQAACRYELNLPCGQCWSCRLERSRQWAVRCVHEAQMHEQNSFVTLTYSPEHLPPDGSLRYRDFQKFMKRLRKWAKPRRVRFYMCGEYGDHFERPHYHACLFGVDFADKVNFGTSGGGSAVYTSVSLDTLWPFGFCTIGEVTFESAAYCARYVMKKVTGPPAEDHYKRVDVETGEIVSVVPEFTHMSLKPGIGGTWFDKFQGDVFPHDFVVVRGKKAVPPRYYDVLHERRDPDAAAWVKDAREPDAHDLVDSTWRRRQVRDQVSQARGKFYKRGFEND